MKNYSIVLFLILAGVILFLLLRPYPTPKGKVLVSQSWLDSLYAVANQPPETLKIITSAPPDTSTYLQPVPIPIEVLADTSLVAFHDSLVNAQFSIHLYDTIRKGTGAIVGRTWQSRLFVPLKVTEYITKTVPMPYPVIQPPKTWQYYGTVWVGQGLQLEGGAIYKGRWKFGTKAGLHSVEIGGGVVF